MNYENGFFMMEKKTAGEFQKLAMKSPAAMATLMFLVSKMSANSAVIVSQQSIANEIGVQRKAVNMAVATLVAQNFIEVIKIGSSLCYRVNQRTIWTGDPGHRSTHFSADILAFEDEQESPIVETPEPLKSIPVSLGTDSDQKEFSLT